MGRKLHIGGKEAKDGWEIFNALKGDAVDHLGDARDLSRFENNTFEAVYASHVVEHFDYAKGDLINTLTEWCRVLAPGGQLYVSVPDMFILCRLFVATDQLGPEERFQIMRMLFGGHMDEWDYHLVGLDQPLLSGFLRGAGFVEITRVQDFGLFDDTSNLAFKGVPISCNLIAKKPG
ncbi:MAG: methyltransferase domain-containing protein [Nitrospirota bacterium]|nr:methyltransferase domain-containing protein [Nitrospirota bacterium]